MIKANELRIGNFLLVDDKIISVHHIRYNSIGVNCSFSTSVVCIYILDKGRIRPIPLDPEILEKCGFEKNIDTGDYWSREGFKLWFDGVGFYHINSELFFHVTYLHQLQNIYFDLCNEEIALSFT